MGSRSSVLLTSPVADPRRRPGSPRLAGRCDLAVVVDHVDGVVELADAVADDHGITVLCDVDVGLGRTGVSGPAGAVAVADAVDRFPRLRFGGVQGYAGHAQHVPGARPDAGGGRRRPNGWPRRCSP